MAKRLNGRIVAAALVVILIETLAARLPLAAQQDSDARRVFALTNQDRQEQGLPPLTWNQNLAAAAEGHAQWMLREP
ncbi:MAG TPA: CAP domain-containing protein, partial [Acidobacteriaceae bacterium]|nr:CAP domain-containing protein [Acidobacteriaceae bacterium]